MVGEYDLLTRTIIDVLELQGETAKSCGIALSATFKMTPKSTEEWINSARKGHIYGTIGTPQNPQKQLGRLSHLLHYLGISHEAEIIEGIREMDERFVYPPEEKRNQQGTKNHLETLLGKVRPKDHDKVRDYLSGIISAYEK
ncbi:hypothetical protein HOD05_03790 [Candidatus Woesearchaeota archaeon]|jgi:hypothetical protein|nr:hypothetical protein [Candidatus Woesearchaeota archaeon]MBT4150675.1 hypothetical protein [Candidatus Woesearchaeota archaeon]MBT4247893.1 hypothetical protein [Candidatus Woesearchaeota archaeon]MBT4434317.1 hypothetical protein [Candidatus Woesearchaeota archaeon]MBT7332294.1 hypothetical protein [Candidatus Woesearchaeota archaeon]